jgi:3,2-trans-enoyl-CoA isomerase
VSDAVLVHRESLGEGVACLRMDRPPANALNLDLVTRLNTALADSLEAGARAVVLTGRPGMFSGGLDVPELMPLGRPEVEAFWRAFFELNRALATCPVPVIAALSGHAPAGGAILALHCDFRVAAAGNFRMGLNEVQVGLPVPPTILVALRQLVGPRQARALAIRGALVPVAEALALGMVDEVVQADELLARAAGIARELLELPPVAMNTTRLNAKAELLDALVQADDARMATDWWFSPETRAGMERLVARLRK